MAKAQPGGSKGEAGTKRRAVKKTARRRAAPVKLSAAKGRRRPAKRDSELNKAMTALAQPMPIVLSQLKDRVAASYDSAQTTTNNSRHWGAADALSANSANSASVRATLRNRARYEVANNCYARGIILTLANDVVGTGPRLQLLGGDQATSEPIERAFVAWARAVNLASKLRTMREAKAQDGEAFALLTTNENLPSGIKLDVQLVECDQVASPAMTQDTTGADGIEYDDYGNPLAYHILRDHPGGTGAGSADYDRVPASDVLHWFRQDRPGQSRGIPEITPALPLFAQLRRWTLASLDAAEVAAEFALLLKTQGSPNTEAVAPLDTFEIERRMMTTLPAGWDATQVKPEHPSTQYEAFKHELINEIARCLNMPYNIAACNSAGYNYASGRLDHQTYYKSIRVEQSQCEIVVLDRIFDAWLEEAARVLNVAVDDTSHQWFWDGIEHVDPAKEANAQATRLTQHTTTLAAEYAKQGKDWEVELRQCARELELMQELKLTPASARPDEAQPQTGEEDGETDDE